MADYQHIGPENQFEKARCLCGKEVSFRKGSIVNATKCVCGVIVKRSSVKKLGMSNPPEVEMKAYIS